MVAIVPAAAVTPNTFKFIDHVLSAVPQSGVEAC